MGGQQVLVAEFNCGHQGPAARHVPMWLWALAGDFVWVAGVDWLVRPSMATHSTVTFPTTRPVSRASFDTASITSLYNPHHAAATEVCELFYGASPPAWNTIERYYDPNAVYENPFITATSKDTIGDVHALAKFLGQLNVPKPGAVLCTLFGLSPEHRWREAWFRGVSMWNEVNDVCECESFGASSFPFSTTNPWGLIAYATTSPCWVWAGN